MKPAPPDAFVSAPLREIALVGSITNPKIQISGMAWHGDELLLLPQYAERLYALPKRELLAHADGDAAALTPRELSVGPDGFAAKFPGFEGFEAIAVVGDRVFLLAEAKLGDDMLGYLVAGKLGPGGVTLDLDSVKALPVSSQVKNMGYE